MSGTTPRRCSPIAAVLTEVLAADDPAGAAGFRQRLAQFQASIEPIQAKIAALRDRLAGTPATATEPIFGYMFDALGMHSRNQSFQLAVMNNTEPSASDVAAFENDLKNHQVKLLIYNSQATDPTADRHGGDRQRGRRPGCRGDRDRAHGQGLPELDGRRTRCGRQGNPGYTAQ